MRLLICLIVCHVGPADHFATYAKELIERGYNVQVYASGPALKKMQECNVEVKFPFCLDRLSKEEESQLAQKIVKDCSDASFVITDVGHEFDIEIQRALGVYAAKIPRFAYYDNPEPFVPGEYSSTAAEVMKLAQGVLFVNENLVNTKIYNAARKEVDFADKKRFGIGYYPVNQANIIAEKRKSSHEIARSVFLTRHKIEDKGQKLLVYFGGNNSEYFDRAFPAFLSFLVKASKLTDLKNIVVVIQQHPGAKVKNQDGQLVEAWLKEFGQREEMPKVVLSDLSSYDAQVLAEGAFYFQTSMGPQFILAGIQPVVQIGHETYEDILVRNHLAHTVTSAEGFAEIIESIDVTREIPREALLQSLGIREDWPEVLMTIMSLLTKG